LGVEEHGGGRQLVRLRCWPEIPVRGPLLFVTLAALALGAAHDTAWAAAAVLGLGALLPALKAVQESAIAMATLTGCLQPREQASDG
jgi:hypothetical protein